MEKRIDPVTGEETMEPTTLKEVTESIIEMRRMLHQEALQRREEREAERRRMEEQQRQWEEERQQREKERQQREKERLQREKERQQREKEIPPAYEAETVALLMQFTMESFVPSHLPTIPPQLVPPEIVPDTVQFMMSPPP